MLVPCPRGDEFVLDGAVKPRQRLSEMFALLSDRGSNRLRIRNKRRKWECQRCCAKSHLAQHLLILQLRPLPRCALEQRLVIRHPPPIDPKITQILSNDGLLGDADQIGNSASAG